MKWRKRRVVRTRVKDITEDQITQRFIGHCKNFRFYSRMRWEVPGRL